MKTAPKLEGIYQNKHVHAFLRQYPKNEWNRIAKSAILLGIKILQKQFPGSAPPVADIEHFLRKSPFFI